MPVFERGGVPPNGKGAARGSAPADPEKPLGIAHAYFILLCICVCTSMYEQSIQRGILAQDYLQTECSFDWYIRARDKECIVEVGT